MPEKKKQHYVPKFYLRYFSNEGSGSHIGLYNFPSQKFIKNAGIEGQAYQDYFYGADREIEEALGQVENKASKIMGQMRKTLQVPQQGTNDYAILWFYIFLQHSRTKHSADRSQEHLDTMIKAAYKEELERMKFDFENHKFAIDNAATINIMTLLHTLPVVEDLKCTIVVNKSESKFITSDNPVVFYNQFLEKRKFQGGRTGLGTKGLQIFFPLSPDILVIMYDNNIYKVGNRNHLRVETRNRTDILSLNKLQILNCEKNIYFPIGENEAEINDFISENMKPSEKLVTRVREYINKNDESKSIIGFREPPVEINLKLSFIKETKNARWWKPSGYMEEVRSQKIRSFRYNPEALKSLLNNS